MTSDSSAKRPRISHVVFIAWLAASSALAIVNHVALFRQTEDVERRLSTSVDSAQLSLYVEKLDQMQEQVSALSLAPAALTETRYAAERQALVDQVDAVKKNMADFALASELQAVQEHMRAVDGRLQRTRRAEASPPLSTKAPALPDAAIPPFAVLGMETRGGERFLSVAPRGARSLADVRLLRVGEAIESWVLAGFDNETALFQVDERQHRIALP